MSDPLIFNVPVEFGLEFMAVFSAYFKYSNGKLFDDVIDEADGVCLGVFLVDFEGSDPGRIIDGGILEPTHLFVSFSFEGQKLNINLALMAGHLFVVSFGVQLAHPCASWKSIEAVAP